MTKTNHWIQVGKIIVVLSRKHTKHIHTTFGQYSEQTSVTTGADNSNHFSLNDEWWPHCRSKCIGMHCVRTQLRQIRSISRNSPGYTAANINNSEKQPGKTGTKLLMDRTVDNLNTSAKVASYYKLLITQAVSLLCATFTSILWKLIFSVRLREDQTIIRGGADRSLVRPGRKQATATKFGIYSTNSTRSTIHFLNRSSKFWKN